MWLLRAIVTLLEILRWPRSGYVSTEWTRDQRRIDSTHGVDQGCIDWDVMRRREF